MKGGHNFHWRRTTAASNYQSGFLGPTASCWQTRVSIQVEKLTLDPDVKIILGFLHYKTKCRSFFSYCDGGTEASFCTATSSGDLLAAQLGNFIGWGACSLGLMSTAVPEHTRPCPGSSGRQHSIVTLFLFDNCAADCPCMSDQ
jgi:hypothetical protein